MIKVYTLTFQGHHEPFTRLFHYNLKTGHFKVFTQEGFLTDKGRGWEKMYNFAHKLHRVCGKRDDDFSFKGANYA